MRRFWSILYADLRRLVRLPAFWILSIAFALAAPIPLLVRLPKLLSGYYNTFDVTEFLFAVLPFIGIGLAVLLPFFLQKTDSHKEGLGLSAASVFASNAIICFAASLTWLLAAVLFYLLVAEIITLLYIRATSNAFVIWFRADLKLFKQFGEALCNLLAHASLALCLSGLAKTRTRRLITLLSLALLSPVLSVVLLPSLHHQLLAAGAQGGFLEYLALLVGLLEMLLPSTGGVLIAMRNWTLLLYDPSPALFSLAIAVLAAIPCLIPPPKQKPAENCAEG